MKVVQRRLRHFNFEGQDGGRSAVCAETRSQRHGEVWSNANATVRPAQLATNDLLDDGRYFIQVV
jgi:hypothetical protein